MPGCNFLHLFFANSMTIGAFLLLMMSARILNNGVYPSGYCCLAYSLNDKGKFHRAILSTTCFGTAHFRTFFT